MNLNANELIKLFLTKEQMTQKELCELLMQKTGKPYTQPNFSRKLNKGTISYNEVILIAEILGYKLDFKPIKNSD